MLAYVGTTAAVALGGIALLVLIDPRTLPWLGGQIASLWTGLSSAVLGFLASFREQR